MTPSKYQQAVYDFVQNGTGSAVVEACAGSGKTSTLIECINLIPSDKSVLVLAFNKTIADELKKRIKQDNIEVKTFNAYGHRILNQHLGKVGLDSYKMRNIVRELMDSYDYREYGEHVLSIANFAKRMGVLPDGIRGEGILPDTMQTWNDLIDHFGVPITQNDRNIAISYAKQAIVKSLNLAAELKTIDFDDQIYIPVIKGLVGDSYDWVFVDEAQDMSKIRAAMVKMAVKEDGRVIAVGDSKQAIYSFCGADSKSLDNFRKDFNAISLPLSISYRCAKIVIKEAQKIVKHIEAFESAPDGQITDFNEKFEMNNFKGGDMVICRRNAPIVSLAFKLITKGIPARVLGRDISGGLVKLIEKLRPKGINGSHGLVEKLDVWRLKEVNKWRKEDRPEMIDAVMDKYNCIMAIVDKTTVNTIPDLISDIEAMFSDDPNNTRAVTLCSIHKAKGLEAETVYFLDIDTIPVKFAKKDWEIEQEYNLKYVGITRAKKNLNYIYSDKIA